MAVPSFVTPLTVATSSPVSVIAVSCPPGWPVGCCMRTSSATVQVSCRPAPAARAVAAARATPRRWSRPPAAPATARAATVNAASFPLLPQPMVLILRRVISLLDDGGLDVDRGRGADSAVPIGGGQGDDVWSRQAGAGRGRGQDHVSAGREGHRIPLGA